MGFTKYAIVCLGARFGWVPYQNHLIQKQIKHIVENTVDSIDDINVNNMVTYDYDKIEAKLLSKRYKLNYSFSSESLGTFSQTLGSMAPQSLPPIFYSSNLCNAMLESLFKNALLNTKIKFGEISCRDIDIIDLAEFYQSSIKKVAVDITDIDGKRIIRNNNDGTVTERIIIDSLIEYGLIGCADWLDELDF
eukprot:50199_1